jgi:hypothetical protein
VGELVVLGLIVFHPGSAVGINASGDHLATSGGQIRHVSVSTPSPFPGTPTSNAPSAPTAAVPTPTAPAVRTDDLAGTLPANIAPQPDFLQSCSGSHYDDSFLCVAATLQAIGNGRSHEGLPPMVLPRNWGQLAPDQQIFVVTNLERTARGLAPLTAMATSLDQAADAGATKSIDPGPPGGFPYSEWGSNWAGAVGNPLEAMYFWMYDDGPGSANVDCSSSNQKGCWGHRQNILMKLPCSECLMGTGWDNNGYQGDPSMTELLVETSGSPAVDFTWRQESPFLP